MADCRPPRQGEVVPFFFAAGSPFRVAVHLDRMKTVLPKTVLFSGSIFKKTGIMTEPPRSAEGVSDKRRCLDEDRAFREGSVRKI